MSKFPQLWQSTVSHWQATNRGSSALYGYPAGPLPHEADIVIVGGGMMGSALSYFLTRGNGAGAGKRVVCIEAKDVASGASGRNGGHVGPKTYALWHQLQQGYPLGAGLSPEEAAWVMQNERDNLDLVESLVEKEGLDVDFRRSELLETHHDLGRTKWCKEQYQAWLTLRRKMGLGDDQTRFVDDAPEAERLSRFRDVTSVHVRPGGSVHPHKLATALMRLALDSPHANFSLHQWTPASGHPARDVPYSGASALQNTYNTLDGHYLVRTGNGELVLGGGTAPLVRAGLTPMSLVHGNEDDSEASIDPAQTKDHATFMRHFIGWGKEAYGEGLVRTWVGVLSSVLDWLPLVGEVPNSPGLSFAGHGMSRIFAVARGYADTLKTGVWDAKLLPECFQITEDRLARAAEGHARWVREHGPDCKVVEGHIIGSATAKL
ncbi:hypothetical protein CspeluHIS016_0302030 [Cutaneotrichosporon spelunceum]|uniref:FAD dependent oxidoreductase domain-containing protein n=1 Tax=Cutaneotrichosporon spelunceum TaxID=1672016 RepID=A0AAD3YBR0_9TREE|nr:hypothetical protein CspeluHIS016_0302030 [Cutaneotrichosporon spelunceum]